MVKLRISGAKRSASASDHEFDDNSCDENEQEKEKEEEEEEDEEEEKEEEEEDGWVGVSFSKKRAPVRQQQHSKRTPPRSAASASQKSRVASNSIRGSRYSSQLSKVRAPQPLHPHRFL